MDKQNSKSKAIVFLTLLFSSSMVLIILFSSLPYNPISITGNSKKYVKALFPQGWEFFTINPQLEKTRVYEYHNKEMKELNLLNASSKNFLGITRLARIKNIEVSFLINQVDTTAWINCKSKLDFQNVIDTSTPVKIYNSTNLHYMQGIYIVQKSKPIPFAWSKNEKIFMPCKTVKIEVI